jgi:DNA-binding HxlR family transcriptional regulator
MSEKPYGLFCPIAKACEVLGPRWTIPILAEMSCGTTRFNDLRRGMPRISPSLLSKRLREMEDLGLIERIIDKGSGTVDYMRTPRAVELHPILVALGNWAQRNVDVETALCDRDARTLMWLLRRKINTDELPPTRVVMRFHFTDAPKTDCSCWMIVKPGVEVDLCLADPGFDVDLYVDTQVPVLTGVLFGRYSLSREIEQERIRLIGAPRISRTIGKWLRLSTFAPSAVLAQMDEASVPNLLRTS